MGSVQKFLGKVDNTLSIHRQVLPRETLAKTDPINEKLFGRNPPPVPGQKIIQLQRGIRSTLLSSDKDPQPKEKLGG